MLTRRLACVLAGATALLAEVVPSAAADTLVTSIPSAARPQNISTYGGTYAWSQLTAGGGSRLIVKVGAAAPVAAPVAPFAAPVDPDVGPRDRSGVPVIVYSRCRAAARCDVFRFDPATGKESKVAAVSKAATSETAPSIWKGAVLFARTGGRSRGAYLYRPGKGTRRLDAKPPLATDLGDSYAAMLRRSGSESFLRFSTYRGSARTIAHDTSTDAGGSVYGPPSLTRYYVYWRANDPISESSSILRIGIRRYAGRGALQRASRPLPPGLDLAAPQRPSGVFAWFVPDASAAGPGPATSLVLSDPPITFG